MSTPTVIVAPNVLLREGIASLLRGTRYKVVASAARPADLSSIRWPRAPQTLAIVGLDLQIENLDEVAESIRLLRSLLPDGKIALLAETVGPIDAQRLLALSTEAGIFNLGSRDALLKVLEFIFLDQRTFVFPKSIATNSKGVTEPPKDSQSHEPSRLGINGHSLSLRENQVLASLVEGKSNKLIARVCHISEATVKVHLKAILRKLEARNRTQAAIWAIKHGYQNLFSEHKGSAVAHTPTSF